MFKCFWLQNMHVTRSVVNPPPSPPPSQSSVHLGMETAALLPFPAPKLEKLGVTPRHDDAG